MTPVSINDALQAATERHRAGRLAEAEALYRQVLARDPDRGQAWHFLGILAGQVNQPETAVELIRRAVTVNPAVAEAWSDLANALQVCGRLEEAIAAHRQALQLEPGFARAWNNLGAALQDNGKFDEAIAACREALRLEPAYPAAQTNLGNALEAAGRREEAVAAHQRAIRLAPKDARFHYNLGNVLAAVGRGEEAAAAFREALRLDPRHAKAHANLGNALRARGELDAAIGCYQEAVRLHPQYTLAFSNLGNALQSAGRSDEAMDACRHALLLDPNCAAAYNNLGDCHFNQGRLDAALDCFKQAMESDPTAAEYHSIFVCCLNYHPGHDAASLLAEARKWDRRNARPLEQHLRPHDNDPTPDRRLRIGYVSADFRHHVVGYNLLPLLREHDHAYFEIFCYSNTRTVDSLTAQIQALSDGWRELASLSDEQAAALIRNDGIDILVDLSMHTVGNRLLLFARKPAPVQMIYLAYCGTTGLGAMDYRLSDPFLDPPETDLACYSERTIRLPHSYWCYEPIGVTPEVSPLPALTAEAVTFGCLNNFAKVSEGALDLWMQILRAAPDSRLLLHAPSGPSRQRIAERFTQRGLSAERLEFVGPAPWPEYLQNWQRVDIGLDPFPYGGGITTCDALWMGVPVVSLSGQTGVGRGGRSILSNVGLPELIAKTPLEYLEIATNLAGDLPRLTDLRSGLRERMERSPLRDAPGCARDVETAYRQAWLEWCSRERAK